MFGAVLHTFNKFHPRLQFTMEVGIDNRLNFLDVIMIIQNNFISFDWYHKNTFSGRYLHFESRYPLCHKKGTVIGLIDRAFRLSSPSFHQKNLEFVVNTLLKNGYPLTFIFSTLQERIKTLITTQDNNTVSVQTTNSMDNESNMRKSYFNIPYVPTISEKFGPVVRDFHVKMSYTGLNKLKQYIRVQKDKLPDPSRNNVIYKIPCMNCNASYVDQTSRLLKTRIAEHRNHIRQNTTQHSVITDHRLSGHEFAWNNVEILDEERIYGKRLMSEMIFIRRQTNSLNLQSDTENLHHAYLTLVENLPKI